MHAFSRLLPFLAWFPMTRDTVRADLLAGLTVSLVLVPQGMAYAQLAGLPVVYGLYAGFIPVIVASLWGSLRQLHTGPTAMLSLLSAAALIPYATMGSEQFIALSIMLALMVGVLRLLLGALRLGMIVNFLSHPVIIGFTNAAALIIGLSQLNKLINVPMPRSEYFLGDLWAVAMQLGSTHWPTLIFALAAFAIIHGAQKWAPRWPGVLIAIIVTTLVSYAIGFERKTTVDLESIQDAELRTRIVRLAEVGRQIQANANEVGRLQKEYARVQNQGEHLLLGQQAIRARIERAEIVAGLLRQEQVRLQIHLHQFDLRRETGADGKAIYVLAGRAGEGEPLGIGHWRIGGLNGQQVVLTGGGEVVGSIPAGLPDFQLPYVDWKMLLPLLPAALVMALMGFMEATSISRAIASRTRQRIDTNQELIGQGLANIVGSFFQSYTVSGSFSRSALAAREGATTGLFAIASALGVVLVMLFFTQAFYHLPQAVLAVVIMFAVFGLIQVRALLHAWQVNRLDALVGWVTFVATLAMAPALANGILIGVALTVLLYLVRNMRPRAEILGFHSDGALGGIDTHKLSPISENYIVMRFDGSLNFVNVAYFEDAIQSALARFPKARAVLVIGNGINDIDVSGEEKIRALAKTLREAGVTLYFSSLKQQVKAVFDGPLLADAIPPSNIFKTKEKALQALAETLETGRPAVGAEH